ncbi:hypothetical protein DTW90_36645 [Neorhizobium sp. P12A]|nr:hypothetical protein DTW90_36645 [Neorhizobium sp. P12A]
MSGVEIGLLRNFVATQMQFSSIVLRYQETDKVSTLGSLNDAQNPDVKFKALAMSLTQSVVGNHSV